MTSEFEKVHLDTSLPLANPTDARGLSNPYVYKYSDKFMQRDQAPNYYPPVVRRQMHDFMTKTSIKFNFGTDESGEHFHGNKKLRKGHSKCKELNPVKRSSITLKKKEFRSPAEIEKSMRSPMNWQQSKLLYN